MSTLELDAATSSRASRFVRQFIEVDLVGAIAGLVLVVVANGAFLQVGALWILAPALLLLVACLTKARQLIVQEESLVPALGLVAAGNWSIALLVPVVLPFLWPVMALTVLMPLVLAAPYIPDRMLLRVIAATAVVASVVGVVGLLGDDGGALPDVDDVLELFAVVGGLVAQLVPIALIAWQNNRLQQIAVRDAHETNEDLTRVQRLLTASRRRVVEAGDLERNRIERDLHDGAQQRLVALGMHLGLLADRCEDMPEIRDTLTEATGEVHAAIGELRELAQGIYPPVLAANGLPDALEAAARRSAMNVALDIDPIGRLAPPVETAVYFTALEAMANASKHAPDATMNLSLERVDLDTGEHVVLHIVDDGPGFDVDEVGASRGLLNMADRVEAVDGALVIDSTPGAGTTLTVSVPVAL